MTFYYSMKQMFRSPMKSFLFFLLIGVSALFLALGGNLWNMNRNVMQEYEDIFTTIGTVDQVGKESGAEKFWDGEKYIYMSGMTYGERISPNVLDFDGADYILKPKQRPCFGALVEDIYTGLGNARTITVEVTPLKTEVADHSVVMRIVKVLEGTVNEGDIIYFCDHDSSKPVVCEVGKTYITQVNMRGYVHGIDGVEEQTIEYQPWPYATFSSQYTLDAKEIEDTENKEAPLEEVTEGFYGTTQGKRWLIAAKRQYYDTHTIPVQPTDGTKLLLPFYKKQAVITKGRDITTEEYSDGKKVCLMSDKTAMILRKNLGDKITLPLYYAAYRSPGSIYALAGYGGVGYYMNAKGEEYNVFDKQEYEIVGIYTVDYEDNSEYGIGGNEVVIPWNAVPENSWEDNIVSHSRMRASTTSFQIPKGTIAQYQELWEKQGIDDLRIMFYDNGYTQIQDGLANRKLMSSIFLISGGVMAVMILLFFSNLFITGQRERIAIERLLGKSKGQCAGSILTGLLVLAAAGCILGSAAGLGATGIAAKSAEKGVVFDTAFSDTAIEPVEGMEIIDTGPSLYVSLVTGGGLLAAAFVIISLYMKEGLKKEPIQLLEELEE